MSSIHSFLKSILPNIQSQHVRDEAYLAESVDMCDLERRLREIDDRATRYSSDLAAGLYTR